MHSDFVDLLVMAALPDERDAIIDADWGAFGRLDWQEMYTPGEKRYEIAEVDGTIGSIRIAVAVTLGQASERMGALTAHHIAYLRPQCAVLVGICAGNPKLDASYGRVLVPASVLKAYGGKTVIAASGADDEHRPDGDQIQSRPPGGFDRLMSFAVSWSRRYRETHPLPESLESEKLRFAAAFLSYRPQLDQHPSAQQTPSGDRIFPAYDYIAAREIESGNLTKRTPHQITKIGRRAFESLCTIHKESPQFECQIGGALATGPDVTEDPDLFAKLHRRYSRHVVGYEREAFGFLQAASDVELNAAFVAKGVQDYACDPKTDRFRRFAARAAASFAIDYTLTHADRWLSRHRVAPDGRRQLSAWPLAWSADWTRSEAARLYGLFESSGQQAIVIEGPRLSGKTRLASALCECARQAKPEPNVILLQMKQLVRDSNGVSNEVEFLKRVLHQMWEGLKEKHQWAPQQQDLSDLLNELKFVFRRKNNTPVYLVIEDADVSLWFGEPQALGIARASIQRLYGALGAVIDAAADETCRAVRQIFTTIRTASELSDSYRVSPFNKAAQIPLLPFAESDVSALAQAAGVTNEQDHLFLFSETGGHRSLIWTILSSWANRSPSQQKGALPKDLSDIPEVATALEILKRDLDHEPNLGSAFKELCRNIPQSRDVCRRLVRRMFARCDETNEYRVLSPLMQRNFTTYPD
jgi:hypothetical protein